MNRLRLSWGIALLLVGVLLAACSSSGSPKHSTSPSDPLQSTSTSVAISDPSTSTPVTSSSTPVITTATVEQTVGAAWLNYWKVSLALTTHPRIQWPMRVQAVAVDPIYGELLNSIRVQQDKLGQVGYGYVISHPYWPKPPAASSKTVVMGDCFDGSHAGTKLAKTGQVKTVGKKSSNIHATLVKGQGGTWRVQQIQYLKSTC